MGERAMKDTDLKVGMHVSIAAVNGVAAYLHGCPCVVEAVNVATDFNGKPKHLLRLLEERKPMNGYVNCRADQMEG